MPGPGEAPRGEPLSPTDKSTLDRLVLAYVAVFCVHMLLGGLAFFVIGLGSADMFDLIKAMFRPAALLGAVTIPSLVLAWLISQRRHHALCKLLAALSGFGGILGLLLCLWAFQTLSKPSIRASFLD